MIRSALMFRRDRRVVLMATVLGAALVGGCADIPEIVLQQEIMTADAGLGGVPYTEGQDMALTPETAPKAAERGGLERPGDDIGQGTPQLVKRANLTLVLSDLEGAVAQVQATVSQVKGDVLGLQDARSPEGYAHQISLTLRVPQAELDAVLSDLQRLGTVQQRALTAQDVSSQLVDLDARLKNLRQSETALLGIMERSGEISHVLEVARELSTVRETIERLAAQQQTLRRQVAYAQIDLTLQSPGAIAPPLRPVGETLGNTWDIATGAVKAVTVDGLKLALWLLAFSPYWALLAAASYGGYRLWLGRQVSPPVPDVEQG